MTALERALWAGVILPPLAWTAHLLAGYALVSLECSKHIPTASLTHLATLLALAVALLGAAAAGWALRAAGRPAGMAASLARTDRRRAMALFGLLSGALFATGILYAEVGAVVLRACS